MAEMQQASGLSRHRFQPAHKSCPPPNKSLQRTRRPRFRAGRSLRSLGSPLSSNPLGDLAHRGSECGERSPGPGHRDSESVANHEALWQGLSFHRGVARFASSWRIGCHSSGGTAPEAARRLSSRAHSSPNPRLQRTRSSASPPRSPLSRQPLGGGSRLQPGRLHHAFVSREPAQRTDPGLAENRPS